MQRADTSSSNATPERAARALAAASTPQRQRTHTRAAAHRNWPVDIVALFWALLEAALFMPPVEMLITWLALGNPLRALRAALFALLGALVGATALYLWGGRDPFSAMTLLSALPGLSPEIMTQAEEALMQNGVAAIFSGVLSAAGGRAEAVFAQALEIGLPAFLATYAAARALRLLLAGCLAFCLGAMLQCLLSRRVVILLWAVAWAAVLWWLYAAVLPFAAT